MHQVQSHKILIALLCPGKILTGEILAGKILTDERLSWPKSCPDETVLKAGPVLIESWRSNIVNVTRMFNLNGLCVHVLVCWCTRWLFAALRWNAYLSLIPSAIYSIFGLRLGRLKNRATGCERKDTNPDLQWRFQDVAFTLQHFKLKVTTHKWSIVRNIAK